jgi:subtilisin family serine protease
MTWITTLTLVISLFSGIILTDRAHAASKGKKTDETEQPVKHRKVAEDLSERARGAIRQETVNVILQLNGPISVQLAALLRSNGVKVKKQFATLNSLAVELPTSVVESLDQFDEVEFVSTDSEIRSFGGHVAHTTGADNVRSMGTSGSLDGSGIGIAILDSGIFPSHVAFLEAGTTRSRIVKSMDFTGQNRTDDPYGHGTHVASAAAGNGVVSNGKYVGIAPKANIVNLRVLNSQGVGTVSGLLSALDWLLANRSTYNVRVANLSLGMPAVNSYRNDPICLAVRRLVDAGVVVVAAAGNNGKRSSGQKIYGQIHSPGNDPSVITIGAVDTKGTDNRADDGVATYSSRGPSRSYWVDVLGRKHYDNLSKPDLAAPGNKLVFAMSPNNKLVQQDPSLNASVSTNPNRNQMRLSGTSMAAPLATGTAALMLQANPKLTPNMVKMILMYTAQQLAGFNMLEQGAGELNVDGAIRMARLVRQDLPVSPALGASLLTGSMPAANSTITYGSSSYTFVWAQGIVLGNSFATGSYLATKYQKVYAHYLVTASC